MRRLLSTGALSLALLAGTAAGAAAQQSTASAFTERAVVWCLSGGTVSGIMTGIMVAPIAETGVGAPMAATAVATSAGIGCGVGLAWAAAVTGYSWAYDTAVGPRR